MNDKTPLNLPFTGIPSFCRYPAVTDLATLDADVAILGVPFDITTQYRPGTGTPSPGGFFYDEVQEILEGIAGLGEVIGFDLTEVAPIYDPTERTTQIAARMITDFIGFILKERERRGELPARP